MTKEQALEQIDLEFATAREAMRSGNDGKVRVCSRRAAAIAIRYWLQSHPTKDWGVDAMNQLRNLQLDERFPQRIRDAARRLTTTITKQFKSPFGSNPIEESRIIINQLMEMS